MSELNLKTYIEEKKEEFTALREEAAAEVNFYSGALAALETLEEALSKSTEPAAEPKDGTEEPKAETAAEEEPKAECSGECNHN